MTDDGPKRKPGQSEPPPSIVTPLSKAGAAYLEARQSQLKKQDEIELLKVAAKETFRPAALLAAQYFMVEPLMYFLRRIWAGITDVEAAEPKNAIQKHISIWCHRATNATLALAIAWITLVLIGGFALEPVQKALGGDLGARLCIIAGVPVVLGGLLLMQRIKRYQVFAIIGVVNVLLAFYEHFLPVLEATQRGDPHGVLLASWILMKGILH